jgi:hypothetical protein
MGDVERERDLLRASLGRTPDCPDIEALAAIAPSPEIERHAASCERCRAELALLHQFEAAEPAADEVESLGWVEAEVTRRREAAAAPSIAASQANADGPKWFRNWRAVSWLAACAVVAVVVTVYQGPGDTGSTIGNGPPVYRSTQVIAVAPLGDVNAPPAEFRWEAVAGAADYHVRLLEVDGAVMWESDTAQNTVRIPPEVVRKLAPGRAFQWDVSARDSAGGKPATSALQSFHILATHP